MEITSVRVSNECFIFEPMNSNSSVVHRIIVIRPWITMNLAYLIGKWPRDDSDQKQNHKCSLLWKMKRIQVTSATSVNVFHSPSHFVYKISMWVNGLIKDKTNIEHMKQFKSWVRTLSKSFDFFYSNQMMDTLSKSSITSFCSIWN